VKTKKLNPTGSKMNVLRQLCNLIPGHLVAKLARETGVDTQARTFSPWSHVVALMFAQLSHAFGLNDVCDTLGLYSGPLSSLRGATVPSRNNLSYANKQRSADLAQRLFWSVLDHLRTISPRFGGIHKSGNRLAWRFKRIIHVVDSTTLQLVASCIDWAKHRRRKAAAKCHLRLDLQSFLPRFAIIDTAAENDNKRAAEVCAGIREGEIVIFDKAYMDLEHLYELTRRGVYWVTRAKDNLQARVCKRIKKADAKIIRDEIITLKGDVSRSKYPEQMRRVVALVEIDGKEQEMTFLTNNFDWSARSVADLYRCRWSIEVFFKQIKQTLQLSDFLGHSANAVRWQIWMALLVYVLLRYQAFLSGWNHSFTRLFAVVRGILWRNYDLPSLLKSYGTASGSFRMMATPQEAYFPGF
jgi:hypothetical protein